MRLSHVPNLRLLKPLLIVSLFLSAIVGCQSKTPHSDNSSQATLTKQAAASNRSINSPVADPKLDKWVNQSIIERAANDGWRSHGRTYDEQRHSPLRDINTENVSNLGLEWYFDLQTDRGIEATPIVHNGMIYVTSAQSVLFALNAKTGEPVWQFDPKIDKAQSAYACCGAVNRGVAIWGESIFLGTLDGRLVSLDATTGSVNWDVLTIDKSRPYTITGAPRVVKGKVIIGNGGAEFGVRGYISAYDVNDGELVWRFFTVPGDPSKPYESAAMEMAAKTWTGDTYWKVGGGGTAWDSMAFDPELDLLYFGVGNGSPWNHEIRSPDGGDNLFLSSIVAVRPDTGDYVWHYQTTPAESWDYTATQHLILSDLEIGGETKKVIMQAPKNGFFYVIDRETGELLSANNYVPVTWASHIDVATGRPVETKEARYSASPSSIQLPGPMGGHNWHPMSYNPLTGLVYIPAQEIPFAYVKKGGFKYSPGGINTAVSFAINDMPDDAAMFKAVKSMLKGRLLAWDPIKQEAAWTVEHNGPWNGGTLTTEGNLVFQGNSIAEFSAYDASDGTKLWTFQTQTGVVAAPITYSIDGEQYVAVAAGWGGTYVLATGGVLPTGSNHQAARLLVFKLGSEKQLPNIEVSDELAHQAPPAPLAVTDQTIALGKELYGDNCSLCHGMQAFSSGLIPNLRYSSFLRDANAWSAVLLDGVLSTKGMPNFSRALGKEQGEAIRAYVIKEANSAKDADYYKGL